MARPRKHPGRCGCESSWTFDDAQENPSCCEHAQTAPCWYALSYECPVYGISYSDYTLGNVREPLLGSYVAFNSGRGGCHFLAKDCITGCSWGDRWTTSAFGYETPLVTITNCPTETVCADVTTPPDSTGLDDTTNAFFDGMFPEVSSCGITCNGGYEDCVPCSWANFCNGGEFTESGLQHCINNVVGDTLLRKKWEMLMISPSEATLTCTSNMGWKAQYYCSNFDPFNKSTFVRNEATVHAKLIGLPVKICVIPISKPVANPCTTTAAKCACMDPGFCSTTIWVSVAGCQGFSGRQTIGLSRMYSVGSGLTGVSMPSPAPCGFFWGTVGGGETSCSGYKNQLGIQIWCDGTTYQIAVYCLKVDNTWEFVDGAAITIIIPTCFGPELAFTLPPVLPCCCGDGTLIETCCCPDDPTADTLAIEFKDGTLTTLTTSTIAWDGSGWAGTADFCGDTGVTIRLECQDRGGNCFWNLYTSNGFSVDASGVSCNPFELAFQTIFGGVDCFGDQISAYIT